MIRLPFLSIGAAFAFAPSLGMAQSLSVAISEGEAASVVEVTVGGSPFSIVKEGSRDIDIVVADSRLSFDLESVNAGRPARLVESIEVVEKEDWVALRVKLTCDCATRTEVADGVAALHVKAPKDASAIEIARARTGRAAGGTRHAPRWTPTPPSRPDAPTRRGEPIARTDADQAPEVEAARASLLKQLTRAADQGLLTFEETFEVDASQLPKETDVEGVADELAAEVADRPAEAVETEASGLARVIVDEDVVLKVRTPESVTFSQPSRERSPKMRCPRRDLLNLPTKLEGDRFLKAQRALRRTLADDRGELSFATLERLARQYIVNGFGAEAEALLTLAQTSDLAPSGKLAPLLEMARYVDQAPTPETGFIEERRHCGDDFLLWAEALSAQRNVAEGGPNTALEIIEATDRASPGLRALLGADLIAARLLVDDVSGARAIDEILRRTPVPSSGALNVQRAALEISDGDRAAGRVMLARIAGGEGPEARDALLRLANDYATGETPPRSLVSRLEDAAMLARTGPLRRNITAAHLRMVALAEGAPSALDAAERALAERRLEDAEAPLLIADVFRTAREPSASNADEVVAFARSALRYGERLPTDPDGDEARARVVSILARNGFGVLARDVLEPVEGRTSPSLERARSELERETDELSRLSSGEAAPNAGSAPPDGSSLADAALDRRGNEATSAASSSEQSTDDAVGGGAAALLDEAEAKLSSSTRIREAIIEALNEDG